jgi:hypothetical protein
VLLLCGVVVVVDDRCDRCLRGAAFPIVIIMAWPGTTRTSEPPAAAAAACRRVIAAAAAAAATQSFLF